MDAQKTIKKYIQPGGNTVAGLVLVILALALLVMGITAMGAADDEALEFYPSESPNDSMAYIDVVGVSDWLYQYDETIYYTVLDVEGYLYTVRLSDSQFKDLEAQYNYWCDESESAVAPEAYRLEGLVKEISTDARKNISEVWQITTSEYDQYFGVKYLDATTSTGEAAATPWFVGALFFGLFGLMFVLGTGKPRRNAKKCLQRLEELGLTERAAEQLENRALAHTVGKNKGVLTQDFVFGKGTGMAVPYSDILWCYQLDQKRNFVPVNSYLMVGTMATAVEAAIDLGRNDKQGAIGEAITIIAQHNPDAMIGYSKENGREFSSIRKGR